uniref:Immunoglobulin domain-containing protein n=1 Tax=Neolamprologus brichardi TaxID=32507 RepID=A0A3Q4MUH7_NEOBR
MHSNLITPLCVPLSLTVAVCRARGQSDDKPVVGKVGGDVRMDIGATEVDSDAYIVWSYGPKDDVIISYDNGTSTKLSEKFQLDANGSLTIRSLTANDSGLYKGQIFSKKVSSQNFNLTVVGEYSKQRITPCNIKSYQSVTLRARCHGNVTSTEKPQNPGHCHDAVAPGKPKSGCVLLFLVPWD